MKSIPSLNKFKSREEWGTYIWKMITKRFLEADSAQEIEKSLDMLLTVYEKKQIIKRASAISLLKQGKSYSEIGELLWLSPQTISAIRKSMRAQAGYVSNYTRNKKPEKKQKPMTKDELDQYPKLMRQLGYSYQFSGKQKRR